MNPPRRRSTDFDGNNESEILALQGRLHNANLARFEQIEENQAAHRTILDTIAANTGDLPHLKARVEALETDSNRVKGAGALSIFLIGAWEVIRAIFFHK